LEGQSLEVLRHANRQGELWFVLILPDGSKSLIPASWTDFKTTIDLPRNPQLTGSLEDLFRLRTLADTLLLRCPAGATVTSGRGQESHAATESELHRHSDSGDVSVGTVRRRAKTAAAFAQQHAIDSGKSVMTVRVYKAGVFSALGHEHEIAAPITGGVVDSAAHHVELHIKAGSLRVDDPKLSVRFPRLSFIYTHQSKTDPEAKLYRKGGGQEARLLGPHSVVTIAAREQQTQDA
jgi:hypothetical protein